MAEVATLKVEADKVEGLVMERETLSESRDELTVWLSNSLLNVDAC